MANVADLIAAVRADLAERERVLIAFSGGVDSSVVAALAHDALGEDAVACTAKSETLPAAELDGARRVAEEIGIRHEIVEFSELDSDQFVQNDGDRCYHCRSMRLGAMYDRARELGIDVVCDGTNASDADGGHRPGLRAVEELNAYSPLLEGGVTKEQVREIAREYDLSVADKPAMACLSSRIPTGLEVTEARLTRVEKAETIMRTWGFEQFRVRDHDGLARIEVGEDELEDALDPEFVRAARSHIAEAGFDHVTIDLHGYSTGSVSPAGEDATSADGTAESGVSRDTRGDGEGESGPGTDGEPLVENVFEADYPMADE